MEIFYGDIDYYNECKKKFYYLYSKSQVFKNHIDRDKSAIVEWKDLSFNGKIIYCPCIDGRYIGIEKDYEKVLEKVPKLEKILSFEGVSKVSVSVKEAYLVISSSSEGIRFRRNLDGEYTLVVE